MLKIDGKEVDLTQLNAMGVSIKFKPGGFIEQRKNGVTVRVDEKTMQQAKQKEMNDVRR